MVIPCMGEVSLELCPLLVLHVQSSISLVNNVVFPQRSQGLREWTVGETFNRKAPRRRKRRRLVLVDSNLQS